MRNFEERKAEIFRRSKERINEKRKKRNRIISICIPVLICLGAYSIFILPAMMPATMPSDPNAADDTHQEIADEVIIYPVSVEFFNNDGNLICSYTENEKIMQLCTVTDSIINENSTLNESEDIALTENSYSVVFTYNTNGKSTYKVIGNTLFNTATEKYYTITPEQKATLDLFSDEQNEIKK